MNLLLQPCENNKLLVSSLIILLPHYTKALLIGFIYGTRISLLIDKTPNEQNFKSDDWIVLMDKGNHQYEFTPDVVITAK